MSENTEIIPTFVEVKGDVIDQFYNSKGNAILMHGANCQKIMGAGFALQVRNRVAPLFYLDQYDPRDGTQRFGNYSAVVLGQVEQEIKIGVNLYTQFNPGANFDYTAFRNALKAFRFSISPDKASSFTIYMPKIGSGIGGELWSDIELIAKQELASFNVVVVDYVEEVAKTEE
tara:strand:- start:1547 stop:2065 length:519 start_codon:yes stop_codon:yes gene_type:complete